MSSYRSDDFRAPCTINSALPNHSGGPVISLSDKEGASIIGVHLESLTHCDDSHKVSYGEQAEDDRSESGQIVASMEEINVTSFDVRPQSADFV